MKDPALFDQAVCAQTDPDLFFPEKGVNCHAAKQLCRSCVHVTDCLTWALHYSVDGVWGATTPRERIELRQQLGITAKDFYKSGQFITFMPQGATQ